MKSILFVRFSSKYDEFIDFLQYEQHLFGINSNNAGNEQTKGTVSLGEPSIKQGGDIETDMKTENTEVEFGIDDFNVWNPLAMDDVQQIASTTSASVCSESKSKEQSDSNSNDIDSNLHGNGLISSNIGQNGNARQEEMDSSPTQTAEKNSNNIQM